MSEGNNVQLIRDLALAKNRIFIGNLPTCTREELESICLPYGKVLGSLVQKNFGFVQFESEEIANKVASALTKSIFKGNTITVRNAGARRVNNNANANKRPEEVQLRGNDCEIVVLDRRNTKYAELVEERLKRLNLRVDLLFPNTLVPLGKVLATISSNGCAYAIIITNQNEEHKSITVNVLHGQKAEHRNMPIEDAIKLISDDFQAKAIKDAAKVVQGVAANQAQMSSMFPLPIPILTADGSNSAKSHPDAIKNLLNLLLNNMPLTVLQYDRLIKYIQERRQQQITNELGEDAPALAPPLPINTADKAPDPEIEVQKQILNIMNKPSVAETVRPKLAYKSLKSVKEDLMLMELLRDNRVQVALDSLMDTAVVTTIEKLFQF